PAEPAAPEEQLSPAAGLREERRPLVGCLRTLHCVACETSFNLEPTTSPTPLHYKAAFRQAGGHFDSSPHLPCGEQDPEARLPHLPRGTFCYSGHSHVRTF